MHILLVRFSSMGDVVLQSATINWLRSRFGKDIRLTFITSQEFCSLINNHPGLDQVVGLDRRKEQWSAFKQKISLLHKEHPISLILDLHGTLRSLRLRMSFWYIPSLVVDKRRWERFFLTKLKLPALRKIIHPNILGLGPQVKRIIQDLETIFGDSNAVWRTQEFRMGPHRELTSLGELPVYELNKPYIVIAPSATYLQKRWPIEYFVKLAQELLNSCSFDLVILAGPEDKFCEAFNVINNPRLQNLQGKTTLSESMAIVDGAILCVGNDSGINHIAEAYGVPCVTIFGPTDPLFGFAPHGERSVFITKNLWCSPCSTTGKSKCFRDRLYCMEGISVDEVKAHVLKQAVGP